MHTCVGKGGDWKEEGHSTQSLWGREWSPASSIVQPLLCKCKIGIAPKKLIWLRKSVVLIVSKGWEPGTEIPQKEVPCSCCLMT